jgi:hypothetical protein
LVESHQLEDEEAEDHSGAQEEACMSRDQDEDSMENLEEHEAHLLASETQSSEERKGMHVEEDMEIALSSYAFHYLERLHRELDDKRQA